MRRKTFIKIYSEIKKEAERKLITQNYSDVILIYKKLAILAYNMNCFYSDLEIENKIEILGEILVKRTAFYPVKNRLIFFDSFGWDNRGLTQQYIRGLGLLEYEILFIFENFDKDKSIEILNEIKLNNKIKIIELSEYTSPLDKINKITNLIEEFSPSKAFLHLSPWCIESIIVWSVFKDIKRFFINLTDHAFWLGNNTFDYCIEFRDYGYSLSTKYRNIPKHKLIKLPYYPIVNLETEFQGFPIETKGKFIITSGSSYYKIMGDGNKFFKLLNKLSKRHNNIIILFAGSGDSFVLKGLIEKYKLNEVFIPIGERKDIAQVVNNSHLYVSTYPVTGGLMNLYAISSLIPIIGYSNEQIESNKIETLLQKNTETQLTYFNEKEFLDEFSNMIENETYRLEKARKIRNSVISVDNFNLELKKIVQGEYNVDFKELELNQKKIEAVYLEVENNYTNICLNFLYSIKEDFPKIKNLISFLHFLNFPIKHLKGRI